MSYYAAFSATIVTEMIICIILGLRQWRELAACFSCNLMTHPLVFSSAGSLPCVSGAALLALLEFGAVTTEATLLRFALPWRKTSELVFVSFLMNTCSFTLGVAFFW